MSNDAFNAHIAYGSPMGDDEGLEVIADWAGGILLMMRPLIEDVLTYDRDTPQHKEAADILRTILKRGDYP